MNQYLAEFQSISKTYSSGFFSRRETIAVKDVSFGLNEGEIFSLIGPNGAGKTTVIRLLLDFIRPTAGRALLFGKPNNDPEVRKYIGYFPERPQFPRQLTVRRFLWHWGRFSGIARESLNSRIGEVVSLVKLDGKEHVLLKDLSKGIAVRVGVAQAIINDPKLLILDEPTDGLDPLGRIEFRDLLLEQKARGKTVLINSHLLSEVEQTSTRIAILDKGEILAVDTLSALTSSCAVTTIRFRGASIETISRLRGNYAIRQSGEEWILTLPDASRLDSALKELAITGSTILSVDQPKGLLEQKFLSLLGQRT